MVTHFPIGYHDGLFIRMLLLLGLKVASATPNSDLATGLRLVPISQKSLAYLSDPIVKRIVLVPALGECY